MKQDKQCHVCGGEADLVSVDREVRIGKQGAVVLDEFMRCGGCEEEYYLPGQMNATQCRAVAAIRAQEGMLNPDEVAAIRAQYGLTQTKLEQILGVGPKTVVRWERGTVCQSHAVDALLKVFRGEPRLFHAYAEARGISLKQKPKKYVTVHRGKKVLRPEGSSASAIPVDTSGTWRIADLATEPMAVSA